jgi:hypothetical protein
MVVARRQQLGEQQRPHGARAADNSSSMGQQQRNEQDGKDWSCVSNVNMFGAPPLKYWHSRQWHCALSRGLPSAT